MDRCTICGEPLRRAILVCYYCGEEWPVRVVVMSEGSHGGWFAVVEGESKRREQSEASENGRGADGDA